MTEHLYDRPAVSLVTMYECINAGALTYPGSDGQRHYARVVGPLDWTDAGVPFLPVERGYYGPGRILATDGPAPYWRRP